VSISSPSPRDKESVLVRTPGDGFDSSGVVNKLMFWNKDLIAMVATAVTALLLTSLVERHSRDVPNEELVVIASRGKLFVIKRPSQPTDLLLVSTELMDERRRRGGG
jgi:hypothetical protein